MRILIHTPNYRKPHLGGVANHYYGLQPYWTQKVHYTVIGSRNKPGRGKYFLPYDILKSLLLMLCWRPKVVVINPSLAPNALRRDLIFLNLAHRMKRPVVIHFHGFDFNYAQQINGKEFCQWFHNASAFIVLSKAIRQQLLDWGITQPIYLSTTKVDDRMTQHFDITTRQRPIRNLLFLGRIETAKGIYVALDAFALIQQQNPELHFTVVGDGSQLKAAQDYANQIHLNHCTFTGALSGDALVQAYCNADLYLFTSYHEGMPTTVLEAMSFGLPVVTRPVGGLADFFESGKMGFCVDSLDPHDFLPAIQTLLDHHDQAWAISQYNHDYANAHFRASQVALHLETIFCTTLSTQL